jgi:DNA-binding transcriptional ArsR family regulator
MQSCAVVRVSCWVVGDWIFLSNHGLALLCIARDPELRIREIADYVGIRERAAHRIVSDLVEAGYLNKEREGNRNRYEIRADVPMRHPLVRDHWIGELLAVLADKPLPTDGQLTRFDGLPERRTRTRRDQDTATATQPPPHGHAQQDPT